MNRVGFGIEVDPTDWAWLVPIRVTAGLALVALAATFLLAIPPLDTFITTPLHVPYRGLEWVRPLPPTGLRILTIALGVSGLATAFGYRPRIVGPVTALLAAYFFFVDSLYYGSTNYLALLLLVLLGAAPFLGPRSTQLSMRIQVGCVYVFSALSKINADWLSGRTLHAMCPAYGPARWLSPIVSAPTFFAFAAAVALLFDLTIVPLVLWRRTRVVAFLALAAFHVHNAITMPMGVVPWAVLAASTVLLAPDWPRRIWPGIARFVPSAESPLRSDVARGFILAWSAVQLLLPLRHFTTPGDPYFHEIGFRFTWAMRSRVKTAGGELFVVDPSGKAGERHALGEGLDYNTELRVALDPHAIWWRAKQVGAGRNVRVYADTWVVINGAPASSPLIDPKVDLAHESFPLFDVPTWVRHGPRGASAAPATRLATAPVPHAD